MDTLRFWDSSLEGCRFDGARCHHVGFVRTEVTDCSFVGADFRQAVLGTWADGGNVFCRVTFGDADFQSSSFVRCRFAGELREVMFYDYGFKTGKQDPNPMEDVDFTA
jgi:uncharacterized protein YjbI with pentapeptide repeats